MNGEEIAELKRILVRLANDEYIAYNQYYLNALAAKGKQLDYLTKVFDTNGKDELDDHYQKLIDWMQSKEISPDFNYQSINDNAGTKFMSIHDGISTRELVDMEITAELEAINSYETALESNSVRVYPDLVTLLGEILIDERTHLRDLQDLKDSMDPYNFSERFKVSFSNFGWKRGAKIGATGGAVLGGLHGLATGKNLNGALSGALTGALAAGTAGAIGGKLIDKEDDRFFSSKDWSDDVDTKWTPPEGLFENGTSTDIAKAEKKGHKDLKSAMASLNYYINRAGKNLSNERKKVLEDAKDELRNLYNTNENFSKADDVRKLAVLLGLGTVGTTLGGWVGHPILGAAAGVYAGKKLNDKLLD